MGIFGAQPNNGVFPKEFTISLKDNLLTIFVLHSPAIFLKFTSQLARSPARVAYKKFEFTMLNAMRPQGIDQFILIATKINSGRDFFAAE